MFFAKERSIRKQLLDNVEKDVRYVDDTVNPEQLAVLTMIRIQNELASRRHRRSRENRESLPK